MRSKNGWRRRLPALWICALTLALAWCVSARGAESGMERRLDPEEIVAAAVGIDTNQYPDAHEVLVDGLVRERFRSDGTGEAEIEEWFKILTEKGRQDARTQTYTYMLPYSTVTVHRAVLYKPDGLCVTVDVARASRVMTDTGQMSANIYDPNHKVLHLALGDLEVGDLVAVSWRRETLKARVPDAWSDYSVLEYPSPIRRLTSLVSAPPELPLLHLRLRDPVSNTVEYAAQAQPDGRTLHRWDVREVPQLFPEPNMPPAHTVAQRLLLSTLPDWQSLSRWYWELSRPRLETVTPEMGQVVTQLVARVDQPETRIRRIFTWVSQNIRYMGITTEDEAPGYEPHDVAKTFANRHGVCRDKAALLVAMLRLAGFEAYPVLIHAGAKLDPDVPMTFFNHAIVAVAEPGGEYKLMDPTDENARALLPSYLGNRSYLVAHPRGEKLRVSPVSPAEDNLLRVSSQGRLDETGNLFLETEMVFEGINDNLYRGHFSRLPREKRRQFFDRLVKARLAGAELVSFELMPADLRDTDQPLSVRFESLARGYLSQGSDRVVLDLPWLSGSIGYANFLLGSTGLPERRFPLATEIACGVEEAISLEVGEACGEPLHLPVNLSAASVGFVFERLYDGTNGVLNASGRFLLQQPEYSPEEYRGIKELRKQMEFSGRHKAHFRPGGAAAAQDSRILSDSMRVDLVTPHRWTTTHHQVREILTYAGLKRHAEVKLPFNPAWQSLELLIGMVANRDGRVHQVKREEINDLDASWVGGAPRYPAAKTRVVALPGVTTGSVTTVSWRRTQTGAPFFSLRHTLRHFDPSEAMSLELSAPLSLALRIEHPGAPATYRCRTNGTHVLHRWEVGPQPALAREESLPPAHVFLPTVLVSCGDWPDYAEHLRQAAERAMSKDREATKLARKLVPRRTDSAARARILRDYVMRRIRPAGPSFLALPEPFSPVDVTLEEGYGHEADRALLLAAMLRAAGLEADPLLVAGDSRDPRVTSPLMEVPQRDLMDRWLVAVYRRPGFWSRLFRPGRSPSSLWDEALPMYLNDGDQYAEPGATWFEGHALLRLSGEPDRVRIPERLRTSIDTEWRLVLDTRGGAQISVTNRYYGAECGGFRRRYAEMSPEQRRRHFMEQAAVVSQAAELREEPRTDLQAYPGLLGYCMEATRFGVRNGDSLTVTLPGAALSLPGLQGDRRDHPYQGTEDSRRTWLWRIRLPAGAAAVPMRPPDIDWTLPGGLGRLQCVTRRYRDAAGDDILEIRRHLRLTPGIVAPQDYPTLLEMNRRLVHPSMRTLVVRIEE